jgi:hypothetical protein
MIAPGSEKRDPPNDPKEPPFTPPPEKKPPLGAPRAAGKDQNRKVLRQASSLL